jgi:hypothetical protein
MKYIEMTDTNIELTKHPSEQKDEKDEKKDELKEIKIEEVVEVKEKENKSTPINKLKIFYNTILIFSLFALTLPFIPVFDLHSLETVYFTIPVSLFAGLIAFNRIPILTDYLHHKEITLMDVIKVEIVELDESSRNINAMFYVKIYRWMLCMCSSVLFSLLVYYFEYEIVNSRLYWIEIFGIVFAYIASFRKIQQLMSHILLYVIHKTKYRCKNYNSNVNLSNLVK